MVCEVIHLPMSEWGGGGRGEGGGGGVLGDVFYGSLLGFTDWLILLFLDDQKSPNPLPISFSSSIVSILHRLTHQTPLPLSHPHRTKKLQRSQISGLVMNTISSFLQAQHPHIISQPQTPPTQKKNLQKTTTIITNIPLKGITRNPVSIDPQIDDERNGL